MTYWIVYDYGYYLEPYCGYASEEQANINLFKAHRARPNAKVKVVVS